MAELPSDRGSNEWSISDNEVQEKVEQVLRKSSELLNNPQFMSYLVGYHMFSVNFINALLKASEDEREKQDLAVSLEEKKNMLEMFKRLANRADLAGEIRRGEKYYREIIHNLGNIGMIFTNPERYPELNCFEDAESLKQEGHLTEFEVDEIKKRTKKGGALKRYTTTAFPLSSSSGPSGKTYKVENVPYLEECRQAKDLTISEIEEIENSNTAE